MKIIFRKDHSIVKLIKRDQSPNYIEFISFSHPDCDPNEVYILSEHIACVLGAEPIEARGTLLAIFELNRERLSPFLVATITLDPFSKTPMINRYFSLAGAIEIARISFEKYGNQQARQFEDYISKISFRGK